MSDVKRQQTEQTGDEEKSEMTPTAELAALGVGRVYSKKLDKPLLHR